MVQLLLAIIYISFISLGLPDALLGASWPTMHLDLGVPVSLAGGISLVVAGGTIVSSLLSDRLTLQLGTGKVTAFSVALTALALFGFSVSTEYWHLLLWAIPYGLGAGSVDACLNNYVAVHYSSRVMSWLHCMWGIGASIGPYVMGMALMGGMRWNAGYRIIAVFQVCLMAVLLLSLPLWKKRRTEADPQNHAPARPLGLGQILRIPGAKDVFVAFFCYCAAEQTAILWGSSYFVMRYDLPEEQAASLGSLFLLGMTLGRGISGFLTAKLSDENMIRLGQGIVAAGLVMMFLPFGSGCAMVGLLLMGLGCAPIYPCIIHATPAHFGADKSQAIIGVQMATAYLGTLAAPPVFGILANHIGAGLLPVYLTAFAAVMVVMCERLNRITK